MYFVPDHNSFTNGKKKMLIGLAIYDTDISTNSGVATFQSSIVSTSNTPFMICTDVSVVVDDRTVAHCYCKVSEAVVG